MIKYFFSNRLPPRLGGWHLAIMIALSQALAFLGAIPGIMSIRFNSITDEAQLRLLDILSPALIVITYLTLLLVGMRFTTSARKRLNSLVAETPDSLPSDEFTAWREITSLTFRYGLAAVVVAFLLNVIPTTIVALLSESSLGSSIPYLQQTVYTLLGGAAAVLGYAILSTFLMGRFTLPFRLALTPKDFDTQIKGRAGALVLTKFLILILALIVISIFILAPIGYQQTSRVLFTDVGPMEIFQELQTQTTLFSILVLGLGFAYAYFASRSISDPITDLMDTFEKIEGGDLSARAPISATDELGIVTIQFNRMVARLESLQNFLEQQVAERTKQLSATNEVGRVASSSLDPAEMLSRVVTLFTDQFGYYFAAIYLLDRSEKWAELHEATGEAGPLLVMNRQRLEVSGNNLVGLAIREKAPRSYPHTSNEKYLSNLPLLPYTRAEIALPLIAADRIIGALNVHSIRENDFSPEIVNTLQNMAGQVAIALENARLFQDAQQNIRELRAIQQQYLLSGWSGMTSQPEDLEYGVGDESDLKTRQIEIPITLRDQVLGQIRLESMKEWTPEQETLINAVASQAAVALENARLINESRQIAVRERMLAEINSRIWSSTTIEGVLQTVVKELGRRYDASHATIELTMEEKE